MTKMITLSLEIYENLKIKYQELRNNLILKRTRLDADSVLCTLLVMTSGERMKFLSDSSLDVTSFEDQEKYLFLERDDLLRRKVINNRIRLVFTVLGLMEMEKELGIIDEHEFLQFIQKKYFDFDESNKKLKASEKTVLLGLITMHCFGEKRAINLDAEETQTVWFHLLNGSMFSFIQSQNIVPHSEKLLATSTGNENPANYLMRRQNDLSKKTSGIFSNPGKNKYFLELVLGSHSETISILSYLFKLILPERISLELINSVKAYTEAVFREFVPVIHGRMEPEDDEWVLLINKALDRVFLS